MHTSPAFPRALGAALFLLFGSAWAPGAARAQQPVVVTVDDIRAMPVPALEHAFWVCDHRATTHGVEATPIGACTAVFEALKQNKFGGDFTELLAWWRENKLVEHTRLESR